MAKHYFAELTEKHPELAQEVFGNFDTALNQKPPDSNTLPWGENIDEVGLAIVVGKSYPTDPYSPLDPTTIDRLSFTANNCAERPSAGEPKEVDDTDILDDSDMLGAPMPEGIDRHTVFAQAKLHALSKSNGVMSYSTEDDLIAPGIVGLAGGIQVRGALVATSSDLWDVHDHIITTMYVNEVSKAAQTGAEPRSADEIATDLKLFFATTLKYQGEVPTEELIKNRIRVRKLLGRINLMIADHQLKTA